MRDISEIIKRNGYSYNIKMPFVFDEQHTYFSNKIWTYPLAFILMTNVMSPTAVNLPMSSALETCAMAMFLIQKEGLVGEKCW